MARKRDRIFALFGAILFFSTSLALSFAVVWQLYKDGHQDSNNKQASSTASGNKLQGTKLADFTPVAKVDSLQKTDTAPGTGSEAKATDTVTVEYTGALASNGVIFQSSKDTGQPVSFALDGVIEGWKEGIPGMKVGGTRRLLIPAAMAYGGTPPEGSGIPANADLVFDVTLDAIGK
jgi:FKBP-type peptidyl-prolyl cis-trans isomerase